MSSILFIQSHIKIIIELFTIISTESNNQKLNNLLEEIIKIEIQFDDLINNIKDQELLLLYSFYEVMTVDNVIRQDWSSHSR